MRPREDVAQTGRRRSQSHEQHLVVTHPSRRTHKLIPILPIHMPFGSIRQRVSSILKPLQKFQNSFSLFNPSISHVTSHLYTYTDMHDIHADALMDSSDDGRPLFTQFEKYTCIFNSTYRMFITVPIHGHVLSPSIPIYQSYNYTRVQCSLVPYRLQVRGTLEFF